MVGVLAVILIVCRCRCLSSYTEFQAVMGCICRVGERLIEGCHASCPESTQRERSGGVCVYWQRHCHADQCRGRLNKEMCISCIQARRRLCSSTAASGSVLSQKRLCKDGGESESE